MGSPPFSFDLDEYNEPLDMSGVSQPAPAPQQSDKAKWIKLAMIAPLLAKGGPGAVEGFLSGLTAADRRRQQQQRLDSVEAQRVTQQNQLDQYRKDTLAGQAQSRQQALLKQFSDAMAGATTPDEVQALRAAYVQQAQAIGMRPGSFDSIALTQTPDKLKQKRIASTWARLPAESKQEALKNGWTLNVDGEMVPFDQWSSQVGGLIDPATGNSPAPEKTLKPPDGLEGNTPEKLHLVAFAKRLGKTPDQLTDAEIQRATKEFRQADDRPAPQSTILIQTVDANGNPIQKFVPRAPGTEYSVAPTAGQQTAMAEQETGMALLNQIESLYKPEFIGPAVGRAYQAQMAIPGAPDVAPDIANFYASVAALRNEIIRLMSGAAVSGAEERRMRSQLPDVTDKPNAFSAKLKQTKMNRSTLLQRIQARSGQPGASMPTQGVTSTGQARPVIDLGGGIAVRAR